jgi:hypothetical protein
MSEQSAPSSFNWKPLLLIPLAVMVAKGASRRRARWESAGFGPGGHRAGYGRHGFGAAFGPAEGRDFRLPPKIEAMLDDWHTHAHEKSDSAETTTV